MRNQGQVLQTSAQEGAWNQLVGAVVSPRATFGLIARKPVWLLPVLLFIMVNLVVGYSFLRTGGERAFAEKQLRSNPVMSQALSQMTPAQRQQNVATSMGMAAPVTYATAVVGTPIVLLIVAAVFLGVFRIGFGAPIKFAQSFAITAFASVPSILKGFLTMVFVWARPPTGASLDSLSMSSLASYLPTGAPPWLQTLGGHLDIFTFWTLGLLGLGYAAASAKKARFRGALITVVIVWAVYVFAHVGIAVWESSMLSAM